MVKAPMKKLTMFLATVLYYGLAKHLPVSYHPLSFGISKPFRGMLCRHMLKKCGRNINVERGAYFGYYGAFVGYDIEIGSNSGIGINASLESSGRISIGENVMMGPDVVILTRNHKHDDITKPMGIQGYTPAPVIIEDDVWIGTRVIILPGVRIGRSSIIGAGAVVTKDVPAYSISAGNPARVVKKRK
jgi:maltose O-acetyltransferase